MRKKRLISFAVSFLMVLTAFLPLLTPIKAEAAVYFSQDMFTSDRSKKGTQSYKSTEVNATSNIFVNVYMDQSFPNDGETNFTGFTEYEFEGTKYHFKFPEDLYSPGNIYNEVTKKDFTLTAQLLVRKDPNKLRLIEPSARSGSEAKFYSPNMSEAEVVKEYRAYLNFLAHYFSQSNAHIDAWVCGNEVNAPGEWNYFGNDCVTADGLIINQDLAVERYSKFYDLVYDAVKAKNKNARVCVCLDHSWTESAGGKIIPTKTFLNKFSAKEGKTKDWCIAYHAYPGGNIYDTRIWASSCNPKNENARYVDGYNLEILTGYVKNNFGTNHRILLTEQGFSASQGPENQAACLVYTFYKARFDDMIDVFHIMKFPGCGFELQEPAATIWKYLDDGSDEHEQEILKQVGGTLSISSFSQITPNWKSQGAIQAERDKHPYEYQGVDYSPVFDPNYYAANNPDHVHWFTLDPVNDPPKAKDMFWAFTRYGMDEGRKTSPGFDLETYKSEHPELVAQFGSDNRSYYTYYCTVAKREQIRAFVDRLYLTTLGRHGEEEGLTYWTDNLFAGNLTGASAAQNFILSPEFNEKNLSYNEFLDVCYAAFFDRPGDEGGYAYWLDVMYNGGSREYVVACFVDSPEFTGICESYGIVRGDLDKTKGAPTGSQGIEPLKVDSSNVNDAELYKYVEKLYTCILDRPSEPAGCEYWVQAIKEGNGMDAGKAASCFFQSQEYKDKRKTDAEFMVDVYQMFFGREPDQGGYDYWLDNLKNERVSRVWLIEEGFGKSPEFREILERFGFVIQ